MYLLRQQISEVLLLLLVLFIGIVLAKGGSERRFVICAQNMIVVVDQKYSLALQVCQRFFSILLVRDFQHQPIKFVSQNLQASLDTLVIVEIDCEI